MKNAICLLCCFLMTESIITQHEVYGDNQPAVQELLLEPIDVQRANREVPVKIYFAQQATDGPRPVVIFSHGLGGSREGSVYLGRHWAQAGYVAVFVQHHGSDSDVWKNAPLGKRFDSLKSAASGQSFLQRTGDIPFVLDQLQLWNKQAGHPLRGRLNLDKIGMSGHSFGGVTTQAMMGCKYRGDRTVGDSRLDAFLVLSPSVPQARTAEQAFDEIRSPVMCMTGTKDGSPIDPSTTPESRQLVYKALPVGDKYQLVLDGGTHAAFSDHGKIGLKRDPKHHPAIQQLSTAFWDAYLKDDLKARKWLQSNAPRELLNNADIWEWK